MMITFALCWGKTPKNIEEHGKQGQKKHCPPAVINYLPGCVARTLGPRKPVMRTPDR